MIVVEAVPFAVTVVGVVLMPPAVAGGAMKSTIGLVFSTTLSVVSVRLILDFPDLWNSCPRGKNRLEL